MSQRERLDAAKTVLARAFIDEPSLAWAHPNVRSRPDFLEWLFRRDIDAIRRSGGWIDLDREEKPRAAAVWLAGANPYVSLPTELAVGFWAVPFVAGLGGTIRLMAISDYQRMWRKRAVPEPHQFLALLGVAPEAQGMGLSRILLDRGLARADEQGFRTALETQTPKNVTLYQHFGFELISSDPIPRGGPTCFAMVRPKTSSR